MSTVCIKNIAKYPIILFFLRAVGDTDKTKGNSMRVCIARVGTFLEKIRVKVCGMIL